MCVEAVFSINIPPRWGCVSFYFIFFAIERWFVKKKKTEPLIFYQASRVRSRVIYRPLFVFTDQPGLCVRERTRNELRTYEQEPIFNRAFSVRKEVYFYLASS